MRILVCEDEEILITAIELRLRKFGLELVLADTLEKALSILREEPPELLVVDMDTEGLSGQEIIGEVRDKMGLNLPIIVIGSMEEDEAILDLVRAGANDFMLKPFKPAELLIRIRSLLLSSVA